MDELSIKVTIANREYPLKIKRTEEGRVLKAAKMLNDRIKEYEEQYSVSDKLDIITMCAVHFASELVNVQEEILVDASQNTAEINVINNLISASLKDSNVHWMEG